MTSRGRGVTEDCASPSISSHPLALMMSSLVMIFLGLSCGYGPVKTLTDASVRNCKGDVSTFWPSIMVGVPVVSRVLRHRKKRPGVDFFFKTISAGLTNLPNQESRD